MPTIRTPIAASALLRAALRAALRVLLAALVGGALAAALRFGLVENDALAIACESGHGGWRCAPRLLAIRGFQLHAFAIASVVGAALALWRRSAVLGGLGVGIGVVGMVLYDFEWSALGMLAGVVAMARLERDRHDDREAERQH